MIQFRDIPSASNPAQLKMGLQRLVITKLLVSEGLAKGDDLLIFPLAGDLIVVLHQLARPFKALVGKMGLRNVKQESSGKKNSLAKEDIVIGQMRAGRSLQDRGAIKLHGSRAKPAKSAMKQPGAEKKTGWSSNVKFKDDPRLKTDESRTERRKERRANISEEGRLSRGKESMLVDGDRFFLAYKSAGYKSQNKNKIPANFDQSIKASSEFEEKLNILAALSMAKEGEVVLTLINAPSSTGARQSSDKKEILNTISTQNFSKIKDESQMLRLEDYALMELNEAPNDPKALEKEMDTLMEMLSNELTNELLSGS